MGLGDEEIQDAQGVGGRHPELVEVDGFAGADHQFTGAVVVVALGAVGNGDPLEVAAPGDGQDDEFVARDAEPDPGAQPPAAGVDAGSAAEAQLHPGLTDGLVEELLFEWVQWWKKRILRCPRTQVSVRILRER